MFPTAIRQSSFGLLHKPHFANLRPFALRASVILKNRQTTNFVLFVCATSATCASTRVVDSDTVEPCLILADRACVSTETIGDAHDIYLIG